MIQVVRKFGVASDFEITYELIFHEVSKVTFLFCAEIWVIHLYRSVFRYICIFILAKQKISDSEQLSRLS